MTVRIIPCHWCQVDMTGFEGQTMKEFWAACYRHVVDCDKASEEIKQQYREALDDLDTFFPEVAEEGPRPGESGEDLEEGDEEE